jgi:anti-anti-sigma factor
MQGELGSLEVALSESDDRATLQLSGELDVTTSPLLQAVLDQLLAAKRRPVINHLVVEMADVRFADAAGLSPVLHARAVLQKRGGCVLVRRPARAVRRVLDVLGLQDLVEARTA